MRQKKTRFRINSVVSKFFVLFASIAALAAIVAAELQKRSMAGGGEASDRMVAALAIAVGVILCLWLAARLVVRPVRALCDAVDQMQRIDPDRDLPGEDIPASHRGDEIGDLGKSVQAMREHLWASLTDHQGNVFGGVLADALPKPVLILDADMIIRYVNPPMSAFLGQAFWETEGKPVRDGSLLGLPLDQLHGSASEIRRALGGARLSCVQTVLRVGDARVSVSAKSILDGESDAIGFVLEFEDVTRQWLSQAAMSSLEATQILAQFHADGTFCCANPQFLEVLSTNAQALEGVTLTSLLKDAGDSAADVVSGLRQGQSFAGLMTVEHQAQELALEGSLICLGDGDGGVERVLLMGRDVSASVSEIRDEKARIETVERDQRTVSEALTTGLRRLSQGDMNAKIDAAFPEPQENLRHDFNLAVDNLSRSMIRIAENAENIHNEAHDISTTADDLSKRTETTAATLEQTAAALDQLTGSVQSAAHGADQADKAVAAAKTNAESSGEVVLETVSAMDQIEESSEKITSIIKVIDDIAFQTNLLALNAGVEAARAGDAGRGFAVVASEVRALAQRSSDAAREINGLIVESGNQVKTGVKLVGKTGEALRQIVESVSEISNLVSDIAGSSKQQSANLLEINNAVTQLDQSTQQNAARLEETTAASEALRNDAMTLVDTIAHFSFENIPGEGGNAKSGPKENTPKASSPRQATDFDTKARAQKDAAIDGVDGTAVHLKSKLKTGDDAVKEPPAVQPQQNPGRADPIATAASGWEDF